MDITRYTAIGARPYQEDRHIVYKDGEGGTLLGVFDGHGGSQTAATLANAIEFIWEDVCADHDTYPTRLMSLFCRLGGLTQEHKSGSTASVVYIQPNKQYAHVAILGDSPVWILDENHNLIKSPEHNIRSNQSERLAAVERGAHCDGNYIYDLVEATRSNSTAWMGAPGLQMSRAFGDYDLRNILSRVPECYPVALGPQSVILVATDGILDPSHNPSVDVVEMLRRMVYRADTADEFVQYALDRHTGDNATAIVADIGYEEEQLPKPEVSNVIAIDKWTHSAFPVSKSALELVAV